MSPTRRDLLKASAGSVAAAVAGLPAMPGVASESINPEVEPVHVVRMYCGALGFELSDGTRMNVIAGDPTGLCDESPYVSIGRHGDDGAVTGYVELPPHIVESYLRMLRHHGDVNLYAFDTYHGWSGPYASEEQS